MKYSRFISLLAKLTGEHGSLTLRIIDTLDQIPEGISITQLSAKVGSSQPSVSRAVKKLIEVGLIEVKRVKDRDKSYTIVKLTSAGETLALILSYADLLFSLYRKGENPILHHIQHLDLNEEIEEYKQHIDRIISKGRFTLKKLILLAAQVLSHEADPFDLDLDTYIELLREYYDIWKSREDILMDAEALLKAAKVLKAQRKWIARSLKLPRGFTDFIESIGEEELGKKLLSYVNPVFTPNTIIHENLSKAISQLQLAAQNRRSKPSESTVKVSVELDIEAARKMGVLDSRKFEDMLANLLTELKHRAALKPVEYFSWITTSTFTETINRAYLTSFLVKRGLATLKIDDGQILITPEPAEEPHVILTSVTYDKWDEVLRWKKIRG